MRRRERIGDLHSVVEHATKTETTARNDLIQRAAGDQLHGDEINAVVLGDVMDGDDTGVIQRRRRLRFLNKTAAAIGVVDLFRWEDLDRDQPVEVRVVRFVDDAHAAFADALEDLVVRELASDHGWCSVVHGNLGMRLRLRLDSTALGWSEQTAPRMIGGKPAIETGTFGDIDAPVERTSRRIHAHANDAQRNIGCEFGFRDFRIAVHLQINAKFSTFLQFDGMFTVLHVEPLQTPRLLRAVGHDQEPGRALREVDRRLHLPVDGGEVPPQQITITLRASR